MGFNSGFKGLKDTKVYQNKNRVLNFISTTTEQQWDKTGLCKW